jgi:hypothetical protein
MLCFWIGLDGWVLCVKRCDGDVWPEWNDGGDGDWPGPAMAWLLWNEWFWRFWGDWVKRCAWLVWSRGWLLMMGQGQAGRHDEVVNEAKMIDDDKGISHAGCVFCERGDDAGSKDKVWETQQRLSLKCHNRDTGKDDSK